jgi:hypothetical protein
MRERMKYRIRKSAEPFMYELVRISDDAILYCQTIENVESYAMNYERELGANVGELVEY